MRKGFTLIELLVVISIIGVLSSIVLTSLNSAKESAQMSKRISLLRQVENALELYYLDNGQYPPAGAPWGMNNHPNFTSAVTLQNNLSPYINIDFYNENQFNTDSFVSFYYRSVPADNYQTYGIQITDITGRYINLAENDGGTSASSYEIGSLVDYCRENYTGVDRGWLGLPGNNQMCRGGN